MAKRRVTIQLVNPFGILQDLLARLFFRYGFFIAKHPHPFIVLPVIVTLLLMLGIFNLHVEDDLRFLYSPENSLSRFEYQIHKEFSGDSVNSSYIAVALEAAPPLPGVEDSADASNAAQNAGGSSPGTASPPWWKNMLRRDVANAIQATMHTILHNMTVELPDGSYHFGNDICARMELCPISNSPVQLFYDAYFSEKLRKDPRIALQWPILKFFENKFFLPTNFYGVQLNESAEGFDAIKSIQVVHLIYYVAGTEKHAADEVGVAVEKALRQALAERAHVLRSSLFSLSILKSEMQKNTTYTLPFISLTILLLMVFTVGSCMTGDWITSKPLEALLGLFSSSLAIGSAAGLLLMLGVPFISQVTVVPFLAFAIGVDDTYVMLGAWQDTKRNQVTSLTSFMSFGLVVHHQVLLRLRGGKTMLRRDVANAIQATMHTILHNMTVELPDGSYHFGNDICARMELCPISNSPVQLFYDAYFSEKLRKDPRIALQWPILKFFENKFFLPTNFYGVQLNESAEGFDAIKSIQVVHLIYYVAGTEKHAADEVGVAVEKALRQALAERAHVLRSSLFSLSILKSEMQKNTTYTLPFISLTILLLMVFTVGSCMTGDWITSKPLEALLGLFSSSLAIGSAAGLLLMLGVTVVPFLAFAIGVDDTYVMLGAWQDTKRNQVTSLTSFMSFGIGSFSATPAISIFCKFIATAILFDYIYQVTFFAAVMALGGRREAAGHHSLFVWRRMSKEEICKAKSTNFVSPTHHAFANILAPFLCHSITRLCFIVLYALYMFGAFYGCSLLRPNLTPSRLLVDDSTLTHYLQLAESRIWSEGVIGRVYVNRAPDFVAQPQQLERLIRMVEELESTPFSMGANSSQLWLREFNNYRQYFAAEDEHNFYDTLKAFLKISFNKQWASFLHWAPHHTKDGKEYVDKFYFTTAFKIPDWNVRTSLLLLWRNITARYPDFQALVFDENNFFSDQMLELKNTTLSSLGTAILAMIFICVLFIADFAIVFWVSFMLVSMDIGVCGYLSLWGSDLDPTTVVNILMSIGLCIDFATHVGYRTYRSRCRDPDERISDALGAIGWPVVQAGVSTFLGIIVMLLVPSNVVRMFARTMVLVVATGLFHGLFLLPIIIRSFAFGVGDHVEDDDGHDAVDEQPRGRIDLDAFARSKIVAGITKSNNKVGPTIMMELISNAKQQQQANRLQQQRPQQAAPATPATQHQQEQQKQWDFNETTNSSDGSQNSSRSCLGT
uniref:SSD domain-containing protein n=1 Tax=Globodera pallida TaxID=36090 RepID=A0A183BPS8_GLOPA